MNNSELLIPTVRRETMKEFEIRNVRGHYEAYINGVFVVSADTLDEAYRLLGECENGMG